MRITRKVLCLVFAFAITFGCLNPVGTVCAASSANHVHQWSSTEMLESYQRIYFDDYVVLVYRNGHFYNEHHDAILGKYYHSCYCGARGNYSTHNGRIVWYEFLE